MLSIFRQNQREANLSSLVKIFELSNVEPKNFRENNVAMLNTHHSAVWKLRQFAKFPRKNSGLR